MQKSFTKILFLFNYKVLRITLGILLMFIAAQAQIPLKPVPITLQTVGVLILGLCYNKKEAMYSIISYVGLGAIGIPVFSGFSSGVSVLISPRGGYIFGMVLCIYVVTTLRVKFGENNWLKLLIYTIIGSGCIYLIGIVQLSWFVGFDKAIQLGLYPFIISGIVKAMFTCSSVNLLKSQTKKNK